MLTYTLDLPIQPQAHETTPADTAHNIWKALGVPSVIIAPLDTDDSAPVFRFSSLSQSDMHIVAEWYNPTETETLLLDVKVHET